MFKIFCEKVLVRFSFVIAFLGFLGVFVYAYYTEIYIPSPDGRAPFFETTIDPSGEGKGIVMIPDKRFSEEKTISLENIHLSNKELQGWISMAVSESLSFDKDDYSTISKKVNSYFTKAGLQEYQDYLLSSNIIKSIKKNNYRMNVFVEQPPLLLNGSTIKGVYRWLYQIPVTITFLKRYEDGYVETKGAVNRKLNLRIQVRRIDIDGDFNAIQIESWDVTGRR